MMQLDMQWVWSVAAGLFVLALWLVAIGAWQWLRQSKELQTALLENEVLAQVWDVADKFVTSAANQMQGKAGAEKREWVLAQLSARFPSINPDIARAALEDAYNNWLSFRGARSIVNENRPNPAKEISDGPAA